MLKWSTQHTQGFSRKNYFILFNWAAGLELIPLLLLMEPVFSALIGRGPTMFCSHWSRWFIGFVRQHSYAIKNQLKAPKAPNYGHLLPLAGSLWHKSAGRATLWTISTNESKSLLALDQWEWRILVEVPGRGRVGPSLHQNRDGRHVLAQLANNHLGLSQPGIELSTHKVGSSSQLRSDHNIVRSL